MTGREGRWGQPTEEELAAIVAAVELAWPRPDATPAYPSAATDTAAGSEAESPWRFSGRWWTRPVAAGRVRPWADRGF